jgi:lysozyme family protein
MSQTNYQFGRKGRHFSGAGDTHNPVSAGTGISFNDFGRMQTQGTSFRLSVPSWALDDDKVRAVILGRLRKYCASVGDHTAGSNHAPKDADLETVEALAQKARQAYGRRADWPSIKDNAYQKILVTHHLKATENGIAGYYARLIYCAYRLGLNSVQLSEETNRAVSPVQARQSLSRLNDVAAELFPEYKIERAQAREKLPQRIVTSETPRDTFQSPSRPDVSPLPNFDAIVQWVSSQADTEPVHFARVWEAIRGDELESALVAAPLFLFAVHDGAREAVRLIQSVIGARIDGTMNDATLAAISSDNPRNVARAFRKAMTSYYQQKVARDPSKKSLLAQWLKRAEAVYI